MKKANKANTLTESFYKRSCSQLWEKNEHLCRNNIRIKKYHRATGSLFVLIEAN